MYYILEGVGAAIAQVHCLWGLCRSKASSSLWAPQVYPLALAVLQLTGRESQMLIILSVFPKENAITKEEGEHGGAISYLWA